MKPFGIPKLLFSWSNFTVRSCVSSETIIAKGIGDFAPGE